MLDIVVLSHVKLHCAAKMPRTKSAIIRDIIRQLTFYCIFDVFISRQKKRNPIGFDMRQSDI